MVRLKYSKSGIMGFIRLENGKESYFDLDGTPLYIKYDRTVNLTPMFPKWGKEGIPHAHVSFLSGSLDAYMDDYGRILDLDGNELLPKWLKKNGWTENVVIDDDPELPKWYQGG